MPNHSRRIKQIVLAIGLIAGLVFLVSRANQSPGSANEILKGKTVIVYRSATCGCCGNYITYLRRAGMRVEEKITADMTAIKKQFSVPEDLTSCHTARIDNYTVEGHVPVEAIQKLLTEKPTIAGITLPKMPSGSPGMPGAKYGTFDIVSFTATGSSSPYMSI